VRKPPTKFQRKISYFIRKHLTSKYIYSNKKTDFSVDFRICDFMIPTNKGGYISKICKGCYSAIALTVFYKLGEKIRNSPPQTPQELKNFEQDLKKIKRKFRHFNKIRFYALSDFHPKDMPYILIASKYFTVDVISKMLALPKNEKYLKQLINKPNIFLSLSFNKTFMKNKERIKKLFIKTKAQNAQLNYTINYLKENPIDPKLQDFSVFHPMNKNKLGIINFGVATNRVCGILTKRKKLVKNDGHCKNCTNCHISLTELQNVT